MHIPMSRADLFKVVKVKRLRDFRSIMQAAAVDSNATGCELCKPAIASILASLYNEMVMKPRHHGLQDTNARFLANIQRNGTFSVVPRMAGGEVTPDGLIAVGQIAKKYGLYTKITGGQRVDMFGAQKADLPDIWEELIVRLPSPLLTLSLSPPPLLTLSLSPSPLLTLSLSASAWLTPPPVPTTPRRRPLRTFPFVALPARVGRRLRNRIGVWQVASHGQELRRLDLVQVRGRGLGRPRHRPREPVPRCPLPSQVQGWRLGLREGVRRSAVKGVSICLIVLPKVPD